MKTPVIIKVKSFCPCNERFFSLKMNTKKPRKLGLLKMKKLTPFFWPLFLHRVGAKNYKLTLF